MKGRADGWKGDPSLLPLPAPFLLSHLPNGAFSPGFVFHGVYFHFLCFLGPVCFLSIFGTLGNWGAPALGGIQDIRTVQSFCPNPKRGAGTPLCLPNLQIAQEQSLIKEILFSDCS